MKTSGSETPRTDVVKDAFKANTSTDDRGCWVWLRSRNSRGYGLAWDKEQQKVVLAHRLSYELFIGQIPDRHHVCHRCDVPHCVNPDHLFAGTDRDNLLDSISKGRRPKTGPTRGQCKLAGLTAKQVIAAKQAILTRTGSLREVSAMLGIPYHTIKDISCGKNY